VDKVNRLIEIEAYLEENNMFESNLQEDLKTLVAQFDLTIPESILAIIAAQSEEIKPVKGNKK
jgi:hypothetical protein